LSAQQVVVVACDLQGYSKLRSQAQLGAFRGLHGQLRLLLSVAADGAIPAEVTVLPTGDGVIVAFAVMDGDGDDGEQAALAAALRLVRGLFAWTDGARELLEYRGISFGIYGGRAHWAKDANGQKNMCGQAINMAARLQAGAGPGTVLVSQTLWDNAVGTQGRLAMVDGAAEVSVCAARSVHVTAKHDVELMAWLLLPTADLPGWSARPVPGVVKRAYLAYPRSVDPSARVMVEAARVALRGAQLDVIEPPRVHAEHALRKCIKQADIVIALAVAYRLPTGIGSGASTSAWIHNTIGAARAGIAAVKPTLVLTQTGITNYGWAASNVLGGHVHYDPDSAADMARMGEAIGTFVERVRVVGAEEEP